MKAKKETAVTYERKYKAEKDFVELEHYQQQVMVEEYARLNNIEIKKHFTEDEYSKDTLECSQLNELLRFLRGNAERVNHLVLDSYSKVVRSLETSYFLL